MFLNSLYSKNYFGLIFGTGIPVQLNNLNNVLELAVKKIWPTIR